MQVCATFALDMRTRILELRIVKLELFWGAIRNCELVAEDAVEAVDVKYLEGWRKRRGGRVARQKRR